MYQEEEMQVRGRFNHVFISCFVGGSCGWKEWEGLCFRPNFYIYTLCDLGRSCNLSESLFSSMKWEWQHRAAVKGKWVSAHFWALSKCEVIFATVKVYGGMAVVTGSRKWGRRDERVLRRLWGEMVNVWMDIPVIAGMFSYVCRWASAIKTQSCPHWFQNAR